MSTPAGNFQTIYEGRDFYVPAFEVKVGGADVPMQTRRDIIEVRYMDNVDKFDTFEITVNNWDEVQRDFKYTGLKTHVRDAASRDELFDPGQEIELWMGYFKPVADAKRKPGEPEPLRLMLAGIITKLEPTFPAAGQPTLKISGANALIKMATKQESFTYPKEMRDSEIAEQIGGRGNLTLGDMTIGVRTNEGAKGLEPVHPEAVLQANQYDILFLIQMAHRNGYDVILQKEHKDGRDVMFLYFGPSTQDPPVNYVLEWGKSLVEFQPTLKTANQVAELSVRAWDVQGKKAINVTVKRDDLPTRPMRDLDRLYRVEQGFKERAEIIADTPFRNEAEAKQYALDKLARLSKDMITAKGTTLGTPGLRAGRKFELQNLGRTFDGQYFVTSSTHTMGAKGYLTEFEARLEEKN